MSFKKLAVPFFVLSLALGACSDDKPAGGSGGSGGGSATGGSSGSGGGTAGSGGSSGSGGGTAGSGGSGGAAGGSGGSSTDTSVEVKPDTATDTSVEVKPDTAPEVAAEAGAPDTAPANICAAYVPNSGALAGISVSDFCDKYETVCTFGGTGRYATKAECMTSYTAAATAAKTCRAGHLCNAAMPNGVMSHCPHATGMIACQ